MHAGDAAAMRAAALFLDRNRGAIQAEVDQRMGRREPPPWARAEIVRRFRSFCRLASIEVNAARPSLDGLGGNSPAALEEALAAAVAIACDRDPGEAITLALRALEDRFRAGLRRSMQPPEEKKRRRGMRRVPNAGKRVRSAIDRIGDAYVALCLDTGRIHDVNPAAENLFGIGAAALLQRPLADFVHPDDREAFRGLEARLDAGEGSGPTELSLARPTGESVAVELTVANHTIAGRRLAILVARERADRIVPLERARPLRPGAAPHRGWPRRAGV
jgi:PAS domain S-box-containing protein